jgi:hypothetical protein
MVGREEVAVVTAVVTGDAAVGVGHHEGGLGKGLANKVF